MADNDRNRGRSAVLVVILVSYVMWRSSPSSRTTSAVSTR
jgi:hypothetical protein